MSETLTEKQREYDQQIRDRNDIETWLAEVLDGSMRTTFTYTYNGDDLIAEDGSAMGPVFAQAATDAERIATEHPELAFELRRRQIEGGEYEDMLDMAKGEALNTMVVVSDFPAELMGAQSDVGGYNVRRRQTMLRVITRKENGSIEMVTQSLDRSDRASLEQIYRYLGQEPRPGELLGQRIYCNLPSDSQDRLPDLLMQSYDGSLAHRFGGTWRAGRADSNVLETFQFVCTQGDLVEAYLTGTKSKQDQFNLAAAMDMRYKQSTNKDTVSYCYNLPIVDTRTIPHGPLAAAIEMALAGETAQANGQTFSGCGASIGASSSAEELAVMGYGNKTSHESLGPIDQYGPLTFECPKGHKNTRPKGKLIECCKTCGVSVKC